MLSVVGSSFGISRPFAALKSTEGLGLVPSIFARLRVQGLGLTVEAQSWKPNSLNPEESCIGNPSTIWP